MERRDVLKYTMFYMGLTLSGGTVAAILSGCRRDESANWQPGFLTTSQAEFLDELAETILPKTNTPGAKEAMVVRFIDVIRPLRYPSEDNQKFKSDLDEFMALANEENKKDFVKLADDTKMQWVTTVDRNAYEAIDANKDMSAEERPFFLVLKEHILAGFFSSEIVAKHYFEYDPVPGGWEACIPYNDVGRAWAL